MAMLMLASLFVACKSTGNGNESSNEIGGESNVGGESSTPAESTEPPKPEASIDLVSGGVTAYTVVRSSIASSKATNISVKLKNAIEEISDGVRIKEDYLLGNAKPDEFEILLGNTNREESAEVLAKIKYHDFKIELIGSKIVIAAHNDDSLADAVDYFIENILNLCANGELKFSTTQEYKYDHSYPAENLTIGGVHISEYNIVVAKIPETWVKNTSNLLVETIRDATGVVLPIVKDSEEPTANEIVLGKTTREESIRLYEKTYGDKEYAIDVTGNRITLAGAGDEFTMRKAVMDLGTTITEGGAIVSKTAVAESKVVLTTACFSDSHNNFAMLEPPYVLRKTHTNAINLILETRGKVDVVMVGGDLMSDYPHWNQSGWWPYKYYTEFKALVVEEFARLSKEEKVIYIAGNHDYAQGELSTDGPGKKGSYNSSEFYFTGPMNEKMGELADADMHWITGTHTGEKYLLGYHYEVNGVHFIGLSPDPDNTGMWSVQGYGFHPDTLKWFKETLNRIDPNGNEIIFVNCHFHLAYRKNGEVKKTGQADSDILPIIKSHSNLFWFFGHLHTGVQEIAASHTAEMIVHYSKAGAALETPANAESYGNAGNRGPTTVYMGAGRIDYDGSLFGRDVVYGYGGYSYKTAVSTTATPKVCQVMYVTVYEDRVEFQSINVGTLAGYTVNDIVEPYTVYLYK